MPDKWPDSVTTEATDFQTLQSAVRRLVRGRKAMAFRGYYAATKEAAIKDAATKREAANEETTPAALVTGLEKSCKSDGTPFDQAHTRGSSLSAISCVGRIIMCRSSPTRRTHLSGWR